MKSHRSREKICENFKEDLELRAIHNLKGNIRVKFESLCRIEVTGHMIADVYFDKWKVLSSFLHFLHSNLHKFFISVNVRCQIL